MRKRRLRLIASLPLAVPVVDGTLDRRVIGIVKQTDVASTYLRHVQGDSSKAAEPGGIEVRSEA